MTDSLRAAREDLAFMKELVEDRGPLPPRFGAQLFWPGLLYGLNVIYCWAGLAGFAPWPSDWHAWAWVPATVVYVPIVIWFGVRGMRQSWGPGARMFAAAWSGVGLGTLTIAVTVTTASYMAGINYAAVWPPIALTLYACGWLVMGILLKRPWALLVAAGCSITAVTMAFLIKSNELWLAMGVGLLLFMAAPGFAMMRASKPAQELT